MLPGRPVAMMMFKTYGYITMSQAMQFTADFKVYSLLTLPEDLEADNFYSSDITWRFLHDLCSGAKWWPQWSLEPHNWESNTGCSRILSTFFTVQTFVGLELTCCIRSNMCDRDQKDKFTCESIHVFGTASIVVRIQTFFIFFLCGNCFADTCTM